MLLNHTFEENTLMKKILLRAAALFAGLVIGTAAWADVYSESRGYTNAVIFTNGGKVIDYITVVPGSTNTMLYFYDLASTTLTYTNAGYTNVSRYTTNLITTYVTSTGITNTLTNSVTYTDVNVVGDATNTYSPIMTYAVPASTITTFTDKLILSKGLTLTNSHALTLIIGYKNQ
jgi:hypothetical protein